MTHIIIYDTEYWSDVGAMEKRWNRLSDKAPTLIQIGAYKVALEAGLPVVNEFLCYSIPRDEFGNKLSIPEFLTQLTNITPETLDAQGVELADALTKFKNFTQNHTMYSFGRDDITPLAISCYMAGIQSPFPATQCRDVRHTFTKAGIPASELEKLNSGKMAAYVGAPLGDDHHEHDARDDVNSILTALRHLESQGKLDINMF